MKSNYAVSLNVLVFVCLKVLEEIKNFEGDSNEIFTNK